jgi:hypothetical protein
MNAKQHDFTITAFADYNFKVEYLDSGQPVNLAGYSAFMQIRKTFNTPAVLSLSDGNGLTIDGALGTVTVHFSGTQTGNLIKGPWLYNLFIVSPEGYRTELIGGTISIAPSATQEFEVSP